jgi:hypothetical protein
MSALPFLKPHSWPNKPKAVGESKYGFDEHDDLIEASLDELIQALETHDHAGVMAAIKALVHCLRSKNGTDTFEEA